MDNQLTILFLFKRCKPDETGKHKVKVSIGCFPEANELLSNRSFVLLQLMLR